MAAAASSSSSSCSSLLPPKKHDVFLSFRGEDTRRTFTSHLFTSLCQRGIRTYIDNELRKGDDISDALTQAIKDSSIAVVIFSENYASSKWCLNELIQILWCKEVQGQLVILVFYQIDPSHVRNQKQTYWEAFSKHESDFRLNRDRVNEWKQALFKTANLAGWDSRTCGNESELIQNIVSDVQQKIKLSYPSSLMGLVGIDENCEKIERLLKKVPIVGIWGMGGLGKTTMAKALFEKLSFKFESSCFLENIREDEEKRGLTYLRDNLLSELLKEETSPHRPPNVANNTFVMRSLSCKKVFIVLDDVSSWKQLDYLAPYCDYLGQGSKVIITTRHKQLLVSARVNEIYEAQPLSEHKSVELFNLRAFHSYQPKTGYESVSQRIVHYAQGIPLVLAILGSSLRSKTPKEWDSALSKLKKIPNQDVLKVLKLSFEGLDDEEKEMFLDIAFFLKGEKKENVITLLESFGFHAEIGLETLVDRTLVTIVGGEVWMHDKIKEMGCEIVRQECFKEPGSRSRLCDPEDVHHVLKNNTGSDAIRGISLDLSQIRDLQLSADTFKKMTNLKFLKFYSSWVQSSCIVNLPSGFDSSFSESLRYLQWDNFPSESLPLSFCAEQLVHLYMPNSHLKNLWDGVQNLVNLRKINLRGSKYLMELPDISTAQNLEGLDLESCESLSHIDPSILSLPRLHRVSVRDCRSLKSLKTGRQSESVKKIDLYGCSSLKEFSFSSNKIDELRFDCSPIEIWDFPIGNMENLRHLRLECSKLKLKNLPIDDMICCMRSLFTLQLIDCGGMIDKSKLRTLFDALLSLGHFDLRGACKLTELPHNIKHLSRLRKLYVSNCKSLQSLPELPLSIKELCVDNCTSLKTLQLTSHIESSMLAEEIMLDSTLYSSVSYLRNLSKLTLRGCEQLFELPKSIDSLFSLQSLDLRGSNIQSLPASIKHLSQLYKIKLSNCRRLCSLPKLPFFVDIVDADGCISLEIVPNLATTPHLRYLLLKDCLKLENCYMESAYFPLKLAIYTRDACAISYPGRKVPEWFKYNQGIDASNNISIELPSTTTDLIGFVLCSVLSHHAHGDRLRCQLYYNGRETDSEKFVDGVIEACGVCPIYASEYRKFIQQMELEANSAAQKETCRDAYETSFHGILKYANFSLKTGKCGHLEASNIPEWFTYKSLMIDDIYGVYVRAEVASDLDKLMGFIFCIVIPNFSSKERDQCYSRFWVQLKGGEYSYLRSSNLRGWHYSMIKLNSDNVFLCIALIINKLPITHYLIGVNCANANCNKQIFEEYICSVIILGQEKLTTKTMDAVVLHVLFATNFLIKKYEVFITVRGEDTATKMMCS
ncbi:hypothetical protein K1719_009177 [Acacia pycnantha]|nr:hypothetical protein K1719_009177 [Acacia pycnantha]